MSNELREIYKDKANGVPILNPFVEMPRMRVNAVNRLNEIIQRDNAMPIKQREYSKPLLGEKYYYLCSNCDKPLGAITENTHFCKNCGQRIDKTNLAF